MCRVVSVTTDQLSLLSGDLASQRSFVLGALIEDALRILRTLPARPAPAEQHLEAGALALLRDAAAELRTLPGEEPVPF